MRKKILTALLFLIFAKLGASQSSVVDEVFYKDCSNGRVDWDTLFFYDKMIAYAFIARSYTYTGQDGKNNFEGTIILLVGKHEIDSINMIRLFHQISERIKLDKFIIFRSCAAHNLYFSAMGPRDERQRNYLRENYIGIFDKSKTKL